VLLKILDGIFNERLNGEIDKVTGAPHILTRKPTTVNQKLWARGHDN